MPLTPLSIYGISSLAFSLSAYVSTEQAIGIGMCLPVLWTVVFEPNASISSTSWTVVYTGVQNYIFPVLLWTTVGYAARRTFTPRLGAFWKAPREMILYFFGLMMALVIYEFIHHGGLVIPFGWFTSLLTTHLLFLDYLHKINDTHERNLVRFVGPVMLLHGVASHVCEKLSISNPYQTSVCIGVAMHLFFLWEYDAHSVMRAAPRAHQE